MTEQQAAEARGLAQIGWTVNRIGERFGLSGGTVSHYCLKSGSQFAEVDPVLPDDVVDPFVGAEWRVIPDHVTPRCWFEASSTGRCRSCMRRNGFVSYRYVPKVVPRWGMAIYHQGDGSSAISKCIAAAFWGLPFGWSGFVEFADRDPNNLRPDNLRWVEYATTWAQVLDGETVIKIRERRVAGEGTSALAKEFGVTAATICDLCYGRTWQQVGGPLLGEGKAAQYGDAPAAKLTKLRVFMIRHARSNGSSYQDLAVQYGVRLEAIRNICLGRTWQQVPGPRDKGGIPQHELRGRLPRETVRRIREARAGGLTYVQIARRFRTSLSHVAEICQGIRRVDVPQRRTTQGATA